MLKTIPEKFQAKLKLEIAPWNWPQRNIYTAAYLLWSFCFPKLLPVIWDVQNVPCRFHQSGSLTCLPGVLKIKRQPWINSLYAVLLNCILQVPLNQIKQGDQTKCEQVNKEVCKFCRIWKIPFKVKFFHLVPSWNYGSLYPFITFKCVWAL